MPSKTRRRLVVTIDQTTIDWLENEAEVLTLARQEAIRRQGQYNAARPNSGRVTVSDVCELVIYEAIRAQHAAQGRKKVRPPPLPKPAETT